MLHLQVQNKQLTDEWLYELIWWLWYQVDCDNIPVTYQMVSHQFAYSYSNLYLFCV